MGALFDINTVKNLAPDIKFASTEHIQFFDENVTKTHSESDTYRKAFFYTLGILPETRKRINSLYDFKNNCPKLDGLNEAWQTSGTIKICRLAFNLYSGFNYNGTTWDNLERDTSGSFTPYELFATPEAFYMLEAIRIRYPEYTKRTGDAEKKTDTVKQKSKRRANRHRQFKTMHRRRNHVTNQIQN
ncbi:MAG: DUF6075 family protein [Candidatus Ornithomonoglobus sp.]